VSQIELETRGLPVFYNQLNSLNSLHPTSRKLQKCIFAFIRRKLWNPKC
jgi:hypothetical protein